MLLQRSDHCHCPTFLCPEHTQITHHVTSSMMVYNPLEWGKERKDPGPRPSNHLFNLRRVIGVRQIPVRQFWQAQRLS